MPCYFDADVRISHVPCATAVPWHTHTYPHPQFSQLSLRLDTSVTSESLHLHVAVRMDEFPFYERLNVAKVMGAGEGGGL